MQTFLEISCPTTDAYGFINVVACNLRVPLGSSRFDCRADIPVLPAPHVHDTLGDMDAQANLGRST
jgi:hypothetical protein